MSVQSIHNDKLALKDSEGRLHEVNFEKERVWDYFPPFEKRRENELPLSTTQKSFLVQITRGDNLCLIVPNINDFQKTLEKHKGNEGSVLRHIDLRWEKLNQAVERLVEDIRGKAERRDEPSNNSPSVLKNNTAQKPILKKRSLSKSKEYFRKLIHQNRLPKLMLRPLNDVWQVVP